MVQAQMQSAIRFILCVPCLDVLLAGSFKSAYEKDPRSAMRVGWKLLQRDRYTSTPEYIA